MKTCILSALILFTLASVSQYPCPNNNIFLGSVNAPSNLNDSIPVSCLYGGDYIELTNMIAGNIYEISTCNNSNFDTEISIYNSLGIAVAYNDDLCGNRSLILFSPATSGSYRILIDEYGCIANQSCARLVVKLVYIKRPVITIPVVIHVLYNTPQQNISDLQIQSQIDVLNEDFRRLNTNQQNAPAVFKGRAMDPLIQFCLAKRTPDGKSTNGILRTAIPVNGSTNGMIDTIIKPNTIWNKNSYLNIWVLNIEDPSIAGYATFPFQSSNTNDGIVMDYQFFGTTGSAISNYNSGHLCTHEVGHWLNLRHIWGDDGLPNICAGSDSIFDTPNHEISNLNSNPTFPHITSCSVDPSGEMFMNFMDYSDDDENLNMFTVGQFIRMDNALFDYRLSLWNSKGCQPCSTTAQFTTTSNNFCTGQPITSINQSSSGNYTWIVNGVFYSNATNISDVFTAPGQYEVKLAVENNGCRDTAFRVINVQSSPSASISPSTTSVCAGSSVVLTASGGGTYNWSNALGNTSQVSASPATNTTYTVTVTNASNCTATASSTITVNAIPSANISPANPSVCLGSSTTLTASGGSTYAWNNSLGTGAIKTVTPASSATVYTVTVTNASNCTATASKTVTVNPNPNTPTFAPSSGCSPLTVTATSANCSNCNYIWSTGSTTPTSVYTVNTNYTVTVTNSFNCTAVSSGAATITGQPVVAITPSNPAFCVGKSVSLTVSPAGTAYAWSGPNNFTSNTQSISASTAGTYAVTVTNPGTCTGTSNTSISVTQSQSPTVSVSNDTTIQAGEPVVLTATGGTTYNWSNNINTQSITVTPSSTSIYTVTVTNASGCTATRNVTVNVSTVCNYSLSSSTASIPSVAGNYSFTLTTTSNCAWSLSESCSWVDFQVINGTGTAVINYSVNENLSISSRSCIVNIQGNIFTITQVGSICNAPVTTFSASATAGLNPFTVNFSDNSTNNPNQWLWSFPGGTPSSSTIQNPTVIYSSCGIFDVSLQTTNSCGSDTTTFNGFINVLCTNITEENQLQSVSIFPNPNNGIFKIVVEQPKATQYQITIVNSLGQKVFEQQSTNSINQTDLSSVTAGLYIVLISDGTTVVQRKVEKY